MHLYRKCTIFNFRLLYKTYYRPIRIKTHDATKTHWILLIHLTKPFFDTAEFITTDLKWWKKNDKTLNVTFPHRSPKYSVWRSGGGSRWWQRSYHATFAGWFVLCALHSASKEAPCLRGTLECMESSWSQKMCKIRENTPIESQMGLHLSLNRLCGCIWFYIKYSCLRSTDFSALCGMPDISGLETLRREEDDGKLPWLWHVSIGLGEGHDCSGAIIQSQWILTDAHCVYDL